MPPAPASELWKRYRPRTFDALIGQPDAVRTIRGWGKRVPHAVLFTGLAGTGKTSAARVLAAQVGCDPTDPADRLDYREINCGSVDPLKTVQELDGQIGGSPMSAAARVWVLDEAQAFSRSRFAQEAMLKILEDGPEKNPCAYLFLCSTDPQKIIKPIRSRCSPVVMKPVAAADLTALIRAVAAAEKITLTPAVVTRIVDRAAGSCRTALVELENVAGIETEADRLTAVGGGVETAAAELFKALLPFKGGPAWGAVSAVLAALKDKEEDPEGLRQMLMAVATGAMLKDGTGRDRAAQAAKLVHYLDTPYLDRNTGWALLTKGCLMSVVGKPPG